MSWPWSRLGLPGPSGMSEIRRAYAEKLRTTHPEEDPEGFQELHAAYRQASRMARQQEREAQAPKPELSPRPAPEAPQPPERFHFDGPLRDSGERPRRALDEGPDWDYARLFADGEREREEYRRRRERERRRKRRGMILAVVCAAAVVTAACWSWLRSWGEELARARDPREQVCRYIEEDTGIKVRALYNLDAAHAIDAYGNVFYLDSDPDGRQFLAGPDGERNMENGRPGYTTNLPVMMMLWALADFAAERGIGDVDTVDRELELERWETSGSFLLSLPDGAPAETVTDLGALLEELSKQPWYQTRPPVCEIALYSGEILLARLQLN